METSTIERPREQELTPTTRTKTCPRCGATLFEDMDVCYGCLYDFRHVPEPLGLPTLEMGSEGQPDEGIWINGPFIDEADSAAGDPRVDGRDSPDGTPEERIAARWPEGANPDVTLVDEAPRQKAGAIVRLRMRSAGLEATLGVGEEGITVGRDAENDVVLASCRVSRHHLRMAPADGGVLIQDLDATNPATVEGMPLSGDVLARPGAVIDVCGTTFEVLSDR